MEFFKGKGDILQFAFCTENLQDFGIEVRSGKNTLHPILSEGLPPTEVFTNIEKLITFLKEQRKVDEPSKEVVEEALEKEREKEAAHSLDVKRKFGLKFYEETDQRSEALKSLIRQLDTDDTRSKIIRDFENQLKMHQDIQKTMENTQLKGILKDIETGNKWAEEVVRINQRLLPPMP